MGAKHRSKFCNTEIDLKKKKGSSAVSSEEK